MTPSTELETVLRRQRVRADALGLYERRPRVFDGSVRPRLEDQAPFSLLAKGGRIEPDGGSRGIRLWLGLPLAIADTVAVELRRERAMNIAIVGRPSAHGGDEIDGLLVAILVSALQGGPEPPLVHVVDCLSLDDPAADALRETCDALGLEAPGRRGDLGQAIGDVDAEVARRVTADNVDARRLLLVLRRVDLAREISLDEFTGDASAPAQALSRILREGPDLGVHTILFADSTRALRERVGRDSLGEFALRVGLAMNAQESDELVGSPLLAKLASGQAVVHSLDLGMTSKFWTLVPPSDEWLRGLPQINEGGFR